MGRARARWRLGVLVSVALAAASAAVAQPGGRATEGVGAAPRPGEDRQVRYVRACLARREAEGPSGAAVYAEMQRQARARGEPPPSLTQHDVEAWLRSALVILCKQEIGLAPDAK